MIASALSAVIGFGREIVTAHFFGTSRELDAFLNASTIPIVIFGIFNGALVAALVPIFGDYLEENRFHDARVLGSSVINGLLICLSIAALIGWISAPLLVSIVAHGFSKQEQSLEINMVRWLMPGIIALTISGVCTGLLNANHKFLAPAFIWVVANAITILVTILLHNTLGIYALVLGTTLGLFSQVIIQLPQIIQSGFYRPIIDLSHPGVAKIWPLLIPVTIGSGASQINLAFDRYFASTLSLGSTSALNYTTKVAYLPVQIVAIGIGTVVFPLIARYFTGTNHDGIKQSVATALRMVTFIVAPCAVVLSVLAFPIVQVLFERGAFHLSATKLCASFIPFACLSLFATSYNTVLSRACYACKEIRLAVFGSLSAVILNIILSSALINFLGARGLLLANGIAGLALVVYLFCVLSRLVGSIDWLSFGLEVFKIALAVGLMDAILTSCMFFHVYSGENPVVRAGELALLLSLAVVTYLGCAWALKLREFTAIRAALWKRFFGSEGLASTGSEI